MASRKRPEMSSLLDERQGGSTGPKKKRNVRKPAAFGLALGLFGAFIIGIIYFAGVLASLPFLRPVRGFLFPLLALTTIILLLPLIFYISFQEEFGDLNPLIPTHYLFLLKKSIKAIRENDFKVEAKNI